MSGGVPSIRRHFFWTSTRASARSARFCQRPVSRSSLLRQGVRHGKDVARGLQIRCDWGPQYVANTWINEVKWLGMTITPSYVGQPQCNGVIERFIRTLKEQCLYLYRFQNLEEARRIIEEFIERYNTEWLIERLGYRTPAQARAEAQRAAA